MVFQFNFSGVTFTASIAAGVSGWVPLGCSAIGADDVEINAAVVYVNGLGGGKVIIRIGLYTLTATVNLLASTGLSGSGENSHITGAGDFHLITINTQDDCFVEYLQLSGTSTGNDVSCVYVWDSDRSRIEGVIVTDSDLHGIYVGKDATGRGGWILNCSVTNTDNNGIIVDGIGGSSVFNFVILGNYVYSVQGDGIHLQDSDYITVSANTVYAASLNGIYFDNCIESTISGNTLSTCVQHGIYNESGQYNTISDNTCVFNDSADTATYDGIQVGTIFGCTVSDNICYGNHRYGIGFGDPSNAGGLRSKIEGNICIFNDREGIYVRGADNQILDNNVYDNGQDAAGTYHGILLHGDSDRADVLGNYVNSPGNTQEDGIQIGDGASNCKVNENYCYNGMGSGITLVANNDYTEILGNYLLDNDDYGIEIVAASCNETFIGPNYITGNGAGDVLDNGTDTWTSMREIESQAGIIAEPTVAAWTNGHEIYVTNTTESRYFTWGHFNGGWRGVELL